MKRFKVMTFRTDREGKKPQYDAYTTWANPEWKGCVVIEVEAKNGTEAKKQAIAERKRRDDMPIKHPSLLTEQDIIGLIKSK